jgi:hypothetical protein
MVDCSSRAGRGLNDREAPLRTARGPLRAGPASGRRLARLQPGDRRDAQPSPRRPAGPSLPDDADHVCKATMSLTSGRARPWRLASRGREPVVIRPAGSYTHAPFVQGHLRTKRVRRSAQSAGAAVDSISYAYDSAGRLAFRVCGGRRGVRGRMVHPARVAR